MPTLGLDCHIILDGTGYWIDPNAYHMIRQRNRRAVSNRTPASGSAGAGQRYIDLGPGKREWQIAVICYQAIHDYAGNPVSSTGQQYRDALHTSYQKVNTTLSYTDPSGAAWTVHFDHLEEHIIDVRAQADGEIQYLCTIILIEA